MNDEDKIALEIGRQILKHFKMLVFTVEGYYMVDKYRGKIICGFVGKPKEA